MYYDSFGMIIDLLSYLWQQNLEHPPLCREQSLVITSGA